MSVSEDLNRQLMLAVKEGNQEKVKSRLDEGASASAFSRESYWSYSWRGYDQSALSVALRAKNNKMTCLLLDRGADANARHDFCGDSPLHLAIVTNNLEAVDHLLEKGASLEARSHKRPLGQDPGIGLGQTPLDAAVTALKNQPKNQPKFGTAVGERLIKATLDLKPGAPKPSCLKQSPELSSYWDRYQRSKGFDPDTIPSEERNKDTDKVSHSHQNQGAGRAADTAPIRMEPEPGASVPKPMSGGGCYSMEFMLQLIKGIVNLLRCALGSASSHSQSQEDVPTHSEQQQGSCGFRLGRFS